MLGERGAVFGGWDRWRLRCGGGLDYDALRGCSSSRGMVSEELKAVKGDLYLKGGLCVVQKEGLDGGETGYLAVISYCDLIDSSPSH